MIVYSAHNGRSYDLPADASTRCAAMASQTGGPFHAGRRCGDMTLRMCCLLGVVAGRATVAVTIHCEDARVVAAHRARCPGTGAQETRCLSQWSF